MAAWHTDCNLKLNMYGIKLSSCVDGKSRRIIWLEPVLNMRAATMLDFFLAACREHGDVRPDCIVTDGGTENVLIGFSAWLSHNSVPELARTPSHTATPHRVTSSVHNVPVERQWGDVNPRFTRLIILFGGFLEEACGFDVQDPVEVGAFQRLIMPLLHVACDSYMQTRNATRVKATKGSEGTGGIPDHRAQQFMRPESHTKPMLVHSVDGWVELYRLATGNDLRRVQDLPRDRRDDGMAIDPLSDFPDDAAYRDNTMLQTLPAVDRLNCLNAADAGESVMETHAWFPLVGAFRRDLEMTRDLHVRRMEQVAGAAEA